MKLIHPRSRWTLSQWRECLVKMLREWRLKAGLTQGQLAERVNREQTFISKYESGNRNLDFFEVLIISRALGMSLNTLLNEFENTCVKRASIHE